MRLRRHERDEGDATDESETLVIGAVELDEFTHVVRASALVLPDLGRTAWLLVGVFALLAALLWLLGTTSSIRGSGSWPGRSSRPWRCPLSACCSATAFRERRARRSSCSGSWRSASLVLVIVLGGITAQEGDISTHAKAAADKAQGWLNSVGVDESGSSSAKSEVESDIPKIIATLTKGVIGGIAGLASLAFALSFLLLSVFFLLKDGPSMRAWVDRHLGLPLPVAQTVTGGVIGRLRGYFRGVTLVAAFKRHLS